MTPDFPYPLVSTDWLGHALGADDLKIVDASWRLPGNPPARADHRQRRIPGAVFFDLDAVADHATELPHMLPSQADFSAAAGALGIEPIDRVVVYDDTGIFSAARVWWTFRAFGHDRVSVLDGGLPKWLREARATEAGEASLLAVRYEQSGSRSLARTHENVRQALTRQSAIVLDARPAARFSADAPEPRIGLRRGHMPGAQNLPHSLLLSEDGTMKSGEALTALLAERNITLKTPVIATCGSGVTAAVIALALEHLGHGDVGLYDGSWTEWGRETNDVALFPVTAGANA
ncbi:MAG: 3-mercaptopyruvate sulfurtransferase [Parvularculaceae bacterium]|nr:3-mercaptopyruvate sulfurtransferase [Parvularculaceae bacterium]